MLESSGHLQKSSEFEVLSSSGHITGKACYVASKVPIVSLTP
jgi:hypothetical protein